VTGGGTSTLREEFLAALVAGDGVRARHLVDRAVAAGTPVPRIYLEVLQPALVEVGRLWECGSIGVGREHYATQVVQSILGALAPRMRVSPTSGRLAVLACLPGEQHALGVQMVGDFLEGAGWEVLQLGASMPDEALVDLVDDEQPDVVGLSCATPSAVHAAERTVAMLRELQPAPFVVLGGHAWRQARPAVGEAAGAAGLGPLELVHLLAERFPPLPDEEAAS
jgi:MerR family transcriptional regulator, light-induced transcriptional regulator